ncbi:MAG: hypothetical protein HY809_09140 [Nitrospirae bacterium]|nr:hypothetical protein [Nitrospirota bacterium]
MRKPPILLISALLLNYGCATHQISGLSDTLVLSEPPEITFSEPVRAAAPEAEEIPVTEKEKLSGFSYP